MIAQANRNSKTSVSECEQREFYVSFVYPVRFFLFAAALRVRAAYEFFYVWDLLEGVNCLASGAGAGSNPLSKITAIAGHTALLL